MTSYTMMMNFQDPEQTILCLELVISLLFSLPLSPLLRQLLFSQMGYKGSGKKFQCFLNRYFFVDSSTDALKQWFSTFSGSSPGKIFHEVFCPGTHLFCGQFSK